MPVFVPSILLLGTILLLGVLAPTLAEQVFKSAQNWITTWFGSFYILAVAAFLVFLIGLACSKYGKIRLGPDDARPEYGFLTWVAMLFAAGMGIGLMYFGVGEPLQHYLAPPLATPGTPDAAREALKLTFFHWGAHAWAIYCVVGLVLAYFGFRYNLPLTVRSGLYPIFRERIHGPIGHAVDIFALCATMFGIAVTLGYGVEQISAGLQTLFGWQTNLLSFKFGLIAVIICMAGFSAASGLKRGVRRLSEINLILAILLMLFVLFAGPTRHLFGAFAENVGEYFSDFVRLTFHTYTYETPRSPTWFGGWTLLYWAWWISWSPFVGMFIARISRGRTVREFIVGVLLIPAAFNLVWMTVFGNTAIWLNGHKAGGALAATAGNVDALLFRFFEYLPGTAITSILAVLLIVVFFVTSADSGSYVLDQMATKSAPHSPVWQRLFWAAMLGVVSAVLMAAGGLGALQSMTLVTALPFTFVMLLLCFSLWKGLAADHAHYSTTHASSSRFWSGQHWKKRLELILHQTSRKDVQYFLASVVAPALEQVSAELSARGQVARIEGVAANGEISLVIPQEKLRDFVYGVRCLRRQVPEFALRALSLPATERAHTDEPVTFFEDGRKGYDIQYLSTPEVIADILRQYELYLRQVQSPMTQLLNTAPGHTKD